MEDSESEPRASRISRISEAVSMDVENADEDDMEDDEFKLPQKSFEGYSTRVLFSEKESIDEEVNNFRKMCKAETFNIHTSWEGAKIPDMPAKELEMTIHSERLQEIVNRMIRKMELVGALPYYLESKGEVLRKYLPKEQVDEVIKVFDKKPRKSVVSTFTGRSKKSRKSYASSFFSSKYSIKINEDVSNMVAFDPIVNIHLDRVINILSKNKCLALYQLRVKVPVSDKVRHLVYLLKRLMKLLMERFRSTAESEHQRQAQLRVALQEYYDRMKLVRKLEEVLLEKTAETDLKIKDKEILIKEYKAKIRRIKRQFKTDIDDLVQDSEVTMLKLDTDSADKQEVLAEDAALAQQNYNACMEEHLAKEKFLRARRYKIETQLAGWVNKYDQEIGDRQEQLESLEEGIDNERKEFIELQCLFKEQEDIYKKYKAQKEQEDREEFARKLGQFRMRIAAKKIQRFWRAYRYRKLARRKAKRDKAKARAAKKGQK